VESLTANYPYSYGYDSAGNKILTLDIKNPERVVKYKIEMQVSTLRGNCEKVSGDEWLKPTELALSTDPAIKDKAEMITLGIKDDTSKIFELAKWVSENIKYDLRYEDVYSDAKTVLLNKAGTCDEFSVLLLSFARALGYPSAIMSGYAYGTTDSKADFQPHSWVAIGDSGCWDPTWGEGGFMDATHIVYGKYPDTTWVDVAVSYKTSNNVSAEMSKMEVKIQMYSRKESPLVSFSATPLALSISKGYEVIKINLVSDKCILTKVKSVGCTMGDKPLFSDVLTSGTVKVCGATNFFTIFKAPEDLRSDIIYKCPIVTSVAAAGLNTTEVVIDPSSEYSDAAINVDASSVYPGEEVHAKAKSQFIFTNIGYSGFDELTIPAPSSSFTIWSYKNGGLSSVDVNVVKYKPIEVEVNMNDSVKLGSELPISICITNKLSKEQEVRVEFRNFTETKTLKDKACFDLTFKPESKDDRIVNIKIFSDGYTTTVVKNVQIIEEKNFLEEIIEAISNFFSGIAEAIAKLFR